MGIIRDDDAEIVLYNPFNGEPFFAYNKNTDKLDAKGKDLENLGSLSTDVESITNVAERVRAINTTTVSDSTFTKVALGNALIDHTEVFTFDGSNDEVTIEKAGTYFIRGQVNWQNDSGWSTGDDIRLQIHANGSSVQQKSVAKVGTLSEDRDVVVEIEASVGDVVSLHCRQDSGADKVIDANPTTSLELVRLG